jgi:uncharacterized protein
VKRVDVRDLLESPGASREVVGDEPVEGLATELASVPDRIRIELLLERVVEGILASGALSGTIAFRCARCLTEFGEPFRLEVSELYATGAPEEDEESYPVQEGTIDLEPLIRDAVLLSIPFSPLCRPDCLGLCERCGGNRNAGECTCPPAAADPRWAVLDQLELDGEET